MQSPVVRYLQFSTKRKLSGKSNQCDVKLKQSFLLLLEKGTIQSKTMEHDPYKLKLKKIGRFPHCPTAHSTSSSKIERALPRAQVFSSLCNCSATSICVSFLSIFTSFKMLKRTREQSGLDSQSSVGNAVAGKGDKARNVLYAQHATRYVHHVYVRVICYVMHISPSDHSTLSRSNHNRPPSLSLLPPPFSPLKLKLLLLLQPECRAGRVRVGGAG